MEVDTEPKLRCSKSCYFCGKSTVKFSTRWYFWSCDSCHQAYADLTLVDPALDLVDFGSDY